MIKLGNQVRDIYTGFTGIATARTDWLFGCSRICIEPQELKDGKPIEGQWFDEQRVEVIGKKPHKLSRDNNAKSGGPRKDPRQLIGG